MGTCNTDQKKDPSFFLSSFIEHDQTLSSFQEFLEKIERSRTIYKFAGLLDMYAATQDTQVAFLFAVGGREDCHNPCNLKWGLNLSYFNMGVKFGMKKMNFLSASILQK